MFSVIICSGTLARLARLRSLDRENTKALLWKVRWWRSKRCKITDFEKLVTWMKLEWSLTGTARDIWRWQLCCLWPTCTNKAGLLTAWGIFQQRQCRSQSYPKDLPETYSVGFWWFSDMFFFCLFAFFMKLASYSYWWNAPWPRCGRCRHSGSVWVCGLMYWHGINRYLTQLTVDFRMSFSLPNGCAGTCLMTGRLLFEASGEPGQHLISACMLANWETYLDSRWFCQIPEKTGIKHPAMFLAFSFVVITVISAKYWLQTNPGCLASHGFVARWTASLQRRMCLP